MIADPNLSKIYDLLRKLAARLALAQRSIHDEEKPSSEELRQFAYLQLQQKMEKHFPEEALLLMEEPSPSEDPPYYWRFYPFPEEENFARGSPKWTLSVCGYERGKLQKTLIVEGSLDNHYWALRNGSSYEKYGRLRVSETPALAQSTLGCAVHSGVPSVPQKLSEKIRTIVSSGSPFLDAAECAAGHSDLLYAEIHAPFSHPAVLLLEEAGGLICDEKGELIGSNSRAILAANGHLLGQIRQEKLLL